ncbi:MAG: hypothetical protein VX834_13440, partial [Myxococcota bacterium]|nr:hypothetical protein [Myxococcota bacterium]
MPNGRNSVRPALVFTLLLVVTACGSPAPKAPDEAQTDASASAKETPSIVAARTSGTISTKSTIRVRFVDDMIQSSQVGVAIAPTVFQFEPALKGIAIWESRRELQFRPEATMPQGTTYQASVNLTEAIGSTPESLELSFQILYQAYEVDLEGLTADPSGNANLQIASGTLQTADVANNRELEQILTASHLNDDLTVKWDHPTERQHRFTIAGITRRDRDSKLTLKLDGSAIGVDRQEATEITVPGKSNFTVTGVRAVAAKDRHIEIRFSDPVRRQRLRGLIRVGNKPLRFTVSGNIVRVYSNRPWLANESVEVAASIQSQNGFNLKSASTHSVQFTMHKPEIRFPGKGVVLPTTSNFTLPIETRSLRAVEVEAIRVNTGQLPQFFQVNSFGGTRELNRVGRTIWKETVELDPTAQADASGWIRYGLNIEPLVNRDTRGLYRLKVSFKRSHITYPCTEDA